MSLVTVTEVRNYLRDHASLNKIFVEREFSDTEILQAIYWQEQMSLSIPPFITDFDPATLPKYTALLGALYQVFFSASMWSQRNNSNLTEQGIPVAVGQNANAYLQIAEMFKTQYTEAVNVFKRAANLDAMTNYSYSPYYSSSSDTDDDGGSYQ